MNRDIFISYKNDDIGNTFASILKKDLDELGYSVYFNPDEERSHSFPEKLKNAVRECHDFILLVSEGCLEQLIRNDKIDWIREELLTAHRENKNIIPILLGKVEMPKDKSIMPKDLQFLPDIDSISIQKPDAYKFSPFAALVKAIQSQPTKEDSYKDDANNNPNYNAKEDFEHMLEKACNGDVDSMYYVACYYHNGICGNINYSEAYKWLQKIINADCQSYPLTWYAYSLLADYYHNGLVPGEAQSYEKTHYYRSRAAGADESAKMKLAAMERIGSGCEFNFNAIEQSFLDVENGDSINKSEQALFYITYGKFDKAIEVYESIDCLMPEAEYQLGLLYKLGVHRDPPKPDYITAGYHLQNAADSGHVQAAYEFGMLSFNPTGKYKKDFNKAEKYFKIAADAGVAEAQYKLGWIYQYALNGTKDIEKSIKYNTLAAKQGHIGAAGSLILLYQEPGYTNYHKAFTYAKQAADAGYANAAFRLANFLFLGKGCKSDEDEALRYYKIAYKHGNNQAWYMMEKLKQIRKKQDQDE